MSDPSAAISPLPTSRVMKKVEMQCGLGDRGILESTSSSEKTHSSRAPVDMVVWRFAGFEFVLLLDHIAFQWTPSMISLVTDGIEWSLGHDQWS